MQQCKYGDRSVSTTTRGHPVRSVSTTNPGITTNPVTGATDGTTTFLKNISTILLYFF